MIYKFTVGSDDDTPIPLSRCERVDKMPPGTLSRHPDHPVFDFECFHYWHNDTETWYVVPLFWLDMQVIRQSISDQDLHAIRAWERVMQKLTSPT